MNKTETRYANYLENAKLQGTILAWAFEPVKFRLAKKTFYTPDFMVITRDQIQLHEVKGFWRDDARVKIKVARETFPWFRWVAVQWKQKEWRMELWD